MSFTNFTSRRLLNSWIGGNLNTPNYGALTGAVPSHIGYHVGGTAPGEDGSNFIEPSGNGYARFPLPGGSGNGFSAATDADPSQIASVAAVSFAAANGGDHGTATHIGFFDAATGGNLLLISTMTVTRTINDGESLSFVAGELKITLD